MVSRPHARRRSGQRLPRARKEKTACQRRRNLGSRRAKQQSQRPKRLMVVQKATPPQPRSPMEAQRRAWPLHQHQTSLL
ncbi:hypothetical protein Micbo1qcDRAFT_157589 [Microdochium bolleyi]|uniref:Uncharacterized protein n=1 Tax=Microdochium bolleyi TaxID=196109 RepID=A0A136JEJ9_9PEZI|nr:hypothetical protein Micbo1qcDRAFT_157589 [Microdochium bolleyi]